MRPLIDILYEIEHFDHDFTSRLKIISLLQELHEHEEFDQLGQWVADEYETGSYVYECLFGQYRHTGPRATCTAAYRWREVYVKKMGGL